MAAVQATEAAAKARVTLLASSTSRLTPEASAFRSVQQQQLQQQPLSRERPWIRVIFS